ncbi:hypothetical protein BBJ29_006620 [Phytophthora kernoviae]|uniref:Uncharacterized protein n=1 Tax=Phytophthora kernoviae TaxID=325452 RepID=A0A3F2RFT1_9STRA|nr:hypothetical protein BBP00_00008289 [Phytophthora kernoviae]RLN70438.1 hypothetical protein BBJ29_006620 [Phytophthora kernoviae]
MHLPRQRPSQTPTDLPRPSVARAQSTEIEASKVLPPQRPYVPSSDRRHLRADVDPYDAFNDYLPERPSKMKSSSGQSSMEARVQSGKFSSRGLYDLEEEKRKLREESLMQQKLMKHRSEPRNLSMGRPLAESELSINFESPHSSKARTSRHNAESFISDVSMAAEPVLLNGDELQRYGVSDDERKAKSSSSVCSSGDEIDITGKLHRLEEYSAYEVQDYRWNASFQVEGGALVALDSWQEWQHFFILSQWRYDQ